MFFHSHVNSIFSDSLKKLGLIRITNSTIETLLALYQVLVRPKLKYGSVVWNSITQKDCKKLESIQKKFCILCHNRFFANQFKFDCGTMLQKLEISSLLNTRFLLDGIFLINLLKDRIYCDSLLNSVGLKTQNVRLRDNSLFYTNRGSYFTRCVNSVNNILRHTDVFVSDTNLRKYKIYT